MGWLERHLNQTDQQRIEAALDAAHAATDGRIVPVLARRSARRGHCFWLASALCLCLAEAALAGSHASLAGRRGPLAGILAALASLLAGRLLARSSRVRRWLTPRADQVEAVHRAAEAAFHRLALLQTPAEAGILLYVSLEERRAVVLAGAGIHAAAGKRHWEEACGLLTRAAAKGALGPGFEEAIAHAARTLNEHHPKQGGGPRQAPGRLHVLHELL